MTFDERLREVADKLRHGASVAPITVRQLLYWFGAQRRGSFNCWLIRHRLEEVGLYTDPDFQSAYIDSQISFVLVGPPSQEDSEANKSTAAELENSLLPDTGSVKVDPTYRISRLRAANKPLLSLPPDATIQRAVTEMLANDFSQLPVMTNERDVKGMISWASLGTRLALGKSGQYVREFMDVHQEIRSDCSIFQAIPLIVQHDYVLVRGSDNKITGIVTASDLSLQFKDLSEPFLLLSEIENHVRLILQDKFASEELASFRDSRDSQRTIDGVPDLTLGEIVRLIENDERWQKVGIPIDRTTFCRELGKVREIRNDVMHFDPDPIEADDMDRLRDFVRLLQRLQAIGVSS